MKVADRWRWLGMVPLLLLALMAQADHGRVQVPSLPMLELGDHLQLWRDPSGKATIAAVSSPDSPAVFRHATSIERLIGYSDDAIWVRVVLQNPDAVVMRRYLELAPPRLRDVRFYHEQAGAWNEIRSGLAVPVEKRLLDSRQLIFPVQLAPNETKAFYLRIKSENAIMVALRLWVPESFYIDERFVDMVNGIQFGAVFLFGLYSLLLYFTLRDNSFLFFSITLVAYGLYDLAILQYGFEFLWPDHAQWSMRSPGIFLAVTIASTGYLISHLLDMPARFPRWGQLVRGLAALALLLVPAMLLFKYSMIVPLVNYLGLLMVVSGLGITLVAVWRRQPDALLLLLAFVMLWFTSLLRIGQVIGVLPAPWMMDYSQSWSMVLSGAVMATALANRMRMLRLENERSSMAVLVERQAAQQRLEAQVHQRTLELMEAKDKAEAASASKSTFLAHMSHELRTPLHSILGYSGLALNSETVALADRRRIEAVQRSGRHLLTLIDELLDYARGEAGRLQLEPRPVYLRSLLESAVEDVLPLAQKAGADLHTAFDQVLPPVVLVDAGRLRQVLINLLGNASRHSRGTRISLDVRRVMVQPEDPARVMLWIGVRDNGIGIPEDARARIFSPFEQVEATATSAGIGLGLPIAAQLVQLMGGELVCECPPEGGCLFYFRIPLQLAPESELAPVRGPLGLRRYEGPVRRILVVDDIAENRALLADVLASLGFDLALAEDGLKALERLESESFDAVIIDQFMPGLSGWQVLRRARERRLSLPFILLSATRAMPPADWPPGLLFVATLMKPVGPDRLAQVLGQVLGLRWSDDELEPTLPAMQALTTLAWPTAASLAELELALGMGQVTDIEEWVAATMEAQPDAEGFAQAVLEAVRRLDFPAIRRLLDLASMA